MEMILPTTGHLSWNALLSTSALTDASIKRSHCRLPAWPRGLSSLRALKTLWCRLCPRLQTVLVMRCDTSRHVQLTSAFGGCCVKGHAVTPWNIGTDVQQQRSADTWMCPKLLPSMHWEGDNPVSIGGESIQSLDCLFKRMDVFLFCCKIWALRFRPDFCEKVTWITWDSKHWNIKDNLKSFLC